MPIVPWRTDTDGFIFVNDWTFDATERGALNGLVAPAMAQIIPVLGAAFPPLLFDPVLQAGVVAAASAYLTLGPLPDYGMCGGMTWSSVDHWLAKAALPHGANRNGQPQHTAGVQATVRNMIWQRLLDSLIGGGALNTTLEWSLILNQVPHEIGGGAGALLQRTAAEWTKIKARIDSGVPCPIGLVYTNRDVWDQHQILVYGYDDLGHGGHLYVYDCNTPHQFGDSGHSDPAIDIVSFDLTGPALSAKSPSDGSSDSLAGFFCTNYIAVKPPAGLAPSFGEFISWQNDTRSWMTAYGALLPVASTAELATLGGSAAGVMPAGVPLPTTVPRPRDNALLREHSAAPVYLYQGGAPFWVPDPAQLMHFGGWDGVRAVPDGTLYAFMGPPANGTLLREFSSSKVFQVTAGVPVPSAVTSSADIRVVPDGALSATLLDSISFSVSRLTIGRGAAGTISLKSPWPDSDLVVNLTCNPGGLVSIPATVTIPRNTLSANFAISTSSIVLPASPLPLQFTAALASTMVSASLPLQSPRIANLTVTPSTITAGGNASGTVAIEVPYAADLVVTLYSSVPSFASVPASVTITKGATTAAFTVSAPANSAAFPTMTVQIDAAALDASMSTTIHVTPSVTLGTLRTLSLSPASVHAGAHVTGTVTLEAPVGTQTRVGIAAIAPGAGPGRTSPDVTAIPTEVDIPAGQVQGSFGIQTRVGATGHVVQIMAVAVATKFASLTLS